MCCVFCKIANKDLQAKVVLESNSLLVIRDISPKSNTHLLIIPKQHFKDMTDISLDNLAVLSQEFFIMTQRLANKLTSPGHFKLVCNNGTDAGQEVFHLHWHFLSNQDLLT